MTDDEYHGIGPGAALTRESVERIKAQFEAESADPELMARRVRARVEADAAYLRLIAPWAADEMAADVEAAREQVNRAFLTGEGAPADVEREAEDRCKECGGPPSPELHPCPWLEEIHGDEETLCNCCDACTESCARDV